MVDPEIDRLIAWLKLHDPAYSNIYTPQEGAPVPPGDTYIIASPKLVSALECKPEIIIPQSDLMTVNTNALNVRDAPSINSNVVARLNKGAKLLIERETVQGDWVVARVWVNRNYLK